MRIIAITTVRNEGDIVAQALAAAAPLVDLLLIVDAGSDDETGAEIARAAQEHAHIHVLPSLPPTLPETVRPQIWAALREHLSPDDWIMIMDADELLDPEVRAKVGRATVAGADHIFSLHANFYYKHREAQKWREGEESLADRARPIQERRCWYRLHTSMPRLWRSVPWLRWNAETYVPAGLVQPARERVLFRHYQYRDLRQIEMRLRTRAGIDPRSVLAINNPHWLVQDVEAALSADDDPDLVLARPGEPLVEDRALPPVPQSPKWKVLLKRGTARFQALRVSPQGSRLYPKLDGAALLRSGR